MADRTGACDALTEAAFTTAAGELIWACPVHVPELRRREGPLTAVFDRVENRCSWTPRPDG
jgi:hypothetical protein